MSAGHAWEHLLPPELANGVGFHPLFLGLETLFFCKKAPKLSGFMFGAGDKSHSCPSSGSGLEQDSESSGCPHIPRLCCRPATTGCLHQD